MLPDITRMLVAVTGGTGFVGAHIVDRLLRRDHEVRILVRNPARGGHLADRGVSVVAGDIGEARALGELLRGADAVVHLVGIIEELGRQSFDRVHVEGTRAVVTAARNVGVSRLVLMSALGARPDTSATDYHKSKFAAEELVRASGLSHAVLRPSLIAGPGNMVLKMLVRMLRFGPVMPVIGDGRYKLQPVHADDVAEAFALAVENPDYSGTFDIAGAEQLTYHQLLDALEAALGVHRDRVSTPVPLVRMAATIGLLVPLLNPISPSQLQMLLEGNTTDNNALVKVMGVTPQPFAVAARELCAPYAASEPAS